MSKVRRLTFFVIRSAGLLSPCTSVCWSYLVSFFPWIQRVPILTCLIFPLPLLFAIPNAALESANIFPFMANPLSDAKWVLPGISQLTSSAFPEPRVTFFWVADHVSRVRRPLRIAPPLVLLAVFLQPASRSRCSRLALRGSPRTRSSRRFGGARRGSAQASAADGGHLGWGYSSPCVSP